MAINHAQITKSALDLIVGGYVLSGLDALPYSPMASSINCDRGLLKFCSFQVLSCHFAHSVSFNDHVDNYITILMLIQTSWGTEMETECCHSHFCSAVVSIVKRQVVLDIHHH